MLDVTAVVPLYRVERYLPDLLASLSAQRTGDYRLEVIFVDDGSPDRSGTLAQHWLDESAFPGTVIRQDNAGVSAARNVGLAAATREWVTFPDSDDLLDPGYFAAVARFLARHGDEVTVASTNLLRLHEPDPVPRNVHALSFRFAAGDRVVPMMDHSDFFQLNVASVFFRRADVLASGVRFRTGLHASEDALFVAEYLLGKEAPMLGLVESARYIYRRRAARDSAVDRFRKDPTTYYERFEDGYLPLMRRAAETGAVPGWLQSMFLYECQWLLPVQMTPEGYAVSLDDEGRARTRAALAACTCLVTDERLFGYDATALPLESRLVLQALAGRDVPGWVGGYVREPGDGAHVAAVVYSVSDDEPVFRAPGGTAITPSDQTAVCPDYFGQSSLTVYRVHLPRRPEAVIVDDVVRPAVPTRRRESLAEQTDRHRRASVGVRGIPARAADVRVWKPVAGPGGSILGRVRRRLSVARLWVGRAFRRRLPRAGD